MALLLAVTSEGVVGWRPHPEVWLLVIGAIAIGFYATRVIQPAAVAAGHAAITRGQKTWFALAVAGTWLASDWPVHDVAEEQLYAVHMGQHLLLSLVLPAMFLLACPSWLFTLVVAEGSRAWSVLRVLSRPIVAGVLFNAFAALMHVSAVVQASLANGAVHFALHLVTFATGLLMWMPVVGPVREWRLSAPGQMVYLFLMSVLPTVPGGWLVFAEDVVYRDYDTVGRLWGLSALEDQQLAGVIMKVIGGSYLWGVILVLFFRWALAEERRRTEQSLERRRAAAAAARAAADADAGASDLTYDDVSRAFAESGPPPGRD
jgi:putative membrane protein